MLEENQAPKETKARQNIYNDAHWMLELYATDGGHIKRKLARAAAALNGISGIHDMISANIAAGNLGMERIDPHREEFLRDGMDVLIELARDAVCDVITDELFQELNSTANETGFHLRKEKEENLVQHAA